jgi:peptidyl-prolyl cis-trans isomerase SurA
MSPLRPFRVSLAARAICAVLLADVCLGGMAQSNQTQKPVVLDHVVAVVNYQAILASDLDEEIRLSVLDPARSTRSNKLTRKSALNLLISRTLIQQQIRREDLQNGEPTQDDVKARIAELRKELPACVHQKCETEAGWKAFLEEHDLTEERVEAYFRYRIEILGFIEQRFRSGIHIPQQDIEDYYRNTLLPQYKPGEAIPTLEKVAPRIEEILLQQHVTALFDEWMTNLRNQGDVEVLDPSLENPKDAADMQNAPPKPEEKESR